MVKDCRRRQKSCNLSSAEKQVQTEETFTSNQRSCTFTDVPRLSVGLSVVPVKVKVKKDGHREVIYLNLCYIGRRIKHYVLHGGA